MQQSSTTASISKSKLELWTRLTLSANYNKGYLRNRPVGSKLMVDFVNFLEAGFIFQTED